MKKPSQAQIKLLQELLEEHHLGPQGFWYFGDSSRKTGDILVSNGLAEKDKTYCKYRVGYRLTQSGRDLLNQLKLT
jgi:hypothetical protein